MIDYAATKGGLTGMMKNLSTRLAEYGITVNDVSPAVGTISLVNAAVEASLLGSVDLATDRAVDDRRHGAVPDDGQRAETLARYTVGKTRDAGRVRKCSGYVLHDGIHDRSECAACWWFEPQMIGRRGPRFPSEHLSR